MDGWGAKRRPFSPMPETLPRVDPKSRAVDGGPEIRIENARPDRVYMLANPGDAYCGLRWALAHGWEVETHRKDGPRFAGATGMKDGANIEYLEQVLVSRPKAEHDADFQRGQAYADLAERRSLEPGGVGRVVGGTGKLAVNTSEIERVRI